MVKSHRQHNRAEGRSGAGLMCVQGPLAGLECGHAQPVKAGAAGA